MQVSMLTHFELYRQWRQQQQQQQSSEVVPAAI
jgi:hypothetical protein